MPSGQAKSPAKSRAARRLSTVFAVLGDPVAHSLSPRIHTAAIRAAGRDAVYVARRVSAAECGAVLRELALAGGGGNVTVPHKERVLPSLDRWTEAVARTRACNTFWARDGVVWGDNTDVDGFTGSCTAVLGGFSKGLEALVLGAGGSARAVIFGLLQRKEVARIHIWNRTPERAYELANHFADSRLSVVRDWQGIAPGVIVNATSAGMTGAKSPIDLDTLESPPLAVVDLVYRRGRQTPLVRQALAMRISAVDGRDMLVRQAEASFVRWFDEPPAPGIMRGAME